MTVLHRTVLEDEYFRSIISEKLWEITLLQDSVSYIELEYSAYLDDYVKYNTENIYAKLDLDVIGNLPSGTIHRAVVHVKEFSTAGLIGGSILHIEGTFNQYVGIGAMENSHCSGGVFNNGLELMVCEGSKVTDFESYGSFTLSMDGNSHCVGKASNTADDDNFYISIGANSSFVNLVESHPSQLELEVANNSLVNMSLTSPTGEITMQIDDNSEVTIDLRQTDRVDISLKNSSTLYYYATPSQHFDFDCDESSQTIRL